MPAQVTPKRLDVATALAKGVSYREAARLTDTSLVTIHRWMSDEAFRNEVYLIRAALVDEIVGKLSEQMTKNVDLLVEVRDARDDQGHLVNPRLSADTARYLIDSLSHLRETVEMDARVREIERRLAQTK